VVKKIICVAVAIVAAGGMAVAQSDVPPERLCDKKFETTFTETFADGSNAGGWTFGNAADTIEEKGGHPSEYLRNSFLTTFAVRARTTPKVPSLFTGNLRANGVVGMEADFKLFSITEFRERPVSLVFVNFNGTPDYFFDDLFVYYVGEENMPGLNTTWIDYEFEIPSQSLTAPENISTTEWEPGWVIAEGDLFTPAIDPDAVWNRVMENVDQTIFWWHDPRLFALIQNFDAGMDNMRVTTCTD
jgi:hypothetical protein